MIFGRPTNYEGFSSNRLHLLNICSEINVRLSWLPSGGNIYNGEDDIGVTTSGNESKI